MGAKLQTYSKLLHYFPVEVADKKVFLFKKVVFFFIMILPIRNIHLLTQPTTRL